MIYLSPTTNFIIHKIPSYIKIYFWLLYYIDWSIYLLLCQYKYFIISVCLDFQQSLFYSVIHLKKKKGISAGYFQNIVINFPKSQLGLLLQFQIYINLKNTYKEFF